MSILKGEHMLVVGLILVLLAVLAMLLFVVGGASDPGSLVVGSFRWDTSTAAVFLAGAVVLLLLVLGLGLTRVGLRQARQRRRDARELERLQRERQQRQEETPAAAETTQTLPGERGATGQTSGPRPAEPTTDETGATEGGAHRGDQQGPASPDTRPEG